MRLPAATLTTLALAACAPSKDAARDSTDTLPSASPPAVVGETARVTAEPMPNVAPRDSSARMPAATGTKQPAPMPNATPPAAPPVRPAPGEPASAPGKKPPTRVVPDPVLPPRDSTARRP